MDTTSARGRLKQSAFFKPSDRGQFAPANRGHFESARRGHFPPDLWGQFGRILQLDDKALLIALCSCPEGEDGLLYDEFVRRFLPEVQIEALNICRKRKMDVHIGKQIAHETFEKLRKYKSFDSDHPSLFSSRKAILIYLFRISRNLFNDWYNADRKAREPYVGKGYFEAITERLSIPDAPNVLLWKRDVAQKIFAKLNKNEQAVVLADIDHKRHGKYLPDEITENLSLSLGIKKDTIRKVRERAIEKIKKAIDEINQQ